MIYLFTNGRPHFPDENRAKLKYAREHFDRVNSLQSEYNYYFKFLSPSSYDLFFHDLRKGKHETFKSKIEAELDVEWSGE